MGKLFHPKLLLYKRMAASSKGSKLIITILKRIIDEPTNSKYQSLNYQKVNDKLQHSSEMMEILYNAGFYKSENGQKLLFNVDSLDTLKLIYNQLTSSQVV
ncbi:MAG: hypothetical protein SV598_03610 [Pseudomonadota bacterium]|nr:hypothetical protein [Pseudomonadota bacterium]